MLPTSLDNVCPDTKIFHRFSDPLSESYQFQRLSFEFGRISLSGFHFHRVLVGYQLAQDSRSLQQKNKR